MAKQEVRTVNGKKYLYYTHYQKSDRIVVYCGPAHRTDAKLKAARLEMKQAAKSVSELQARRRELRADIARLSSAAKSEGAKKGAGGSGGGRRAKKRPRAAKQ
ncbi:MAG: hypothetical protein J4F28_03155 [Nitrosopumilaceae archaeon]|nr:hypothetical protein [Nitrosopumilaceae archaeon]